MPNPNRFRLFWIYLLNAQNKITSETHNETQNKI
jgi:hypothetical protein